MTIDRASFDTLASMVQLTADNAERLLAAGDAVTAYKLARLARFWLGAMVAIRRAS